MMWFFGLMEGLAVQVYLDSQLKLDQMLCHLVPRASHRILTLTHGIKMLIFFSFNLLLELDSPLTKTIPMFIMKVEQHQTVLQH